MNEIDAEFEGRAGALPWLGIGLSVDLYSPNLFNLVGALRAVGCSFGYLELFKASESGLREVGRRLPDVPFAFHGEGLWLTQPDFQGTPQGECELDATIAQLNVLGCRWINHECASKQIGGYAFGTYLPPLFTEAAAEVVAENARYIQTRLDRGCLSADGRAPFLLLEVPPWTYFGAGHLEVPAFFTLITAQAPCGLVLDLGHLWTVYRYSGAWRTQSLRDFAARFFDDFPLERVVQIHVAGLALHEQLPESPNETFTELPLWIDAHGAPIPAVLFELLAQALATGRMTHLKGVALEVDTKSIDLIVEEFGRCHDRFGEWSPSPSAPRSTVRGEASGQPLHREPRPFLPETERAVVRAHYRSYAETAIGSVSTVAPTNLPQASIDPAMLALYRETYLPYEILRWGGDLRAMFPETCGLLDRAEVTLDRFVAYWFREPRASDAPYDFFLLKIDRFLAFVREILPWASDVASQEAADLRVGYQLACEQVSSDE